MGRTPRKFSPEFKVKLVLAVLKGTSSAGEICRTYKLKPDLVTRWKQEFRENAERAFERDSDREREQARIAELERLMGRLTLELEVANKASSILSQRAKSDGSSSSCWGLTIQSGRSVRWWASPAAATPTRATR